MLLLWPNSAIGIWLLLDFGRQFNKSPDCFSTRWEVGLAATPVVYRPQKLLRYPHLKTGDLEGVSMGGHEAVSDVAHSPQVVWRCDG